jgi:NAD(P)-dependent dehydrogenase (short-subunit alcohol dehydrogenase family)
MKISGTTAVITGASYGIGAETAYALARAGARVVLLARTRAALDKVAANVPAAGGAAGVYPCDLTDPVAVNQTAEAILADVGVPDLLVHSAGAGRWLAIEETDPDEAVQMMAVPYFATFFVIRAFIPAMLRRNRGHIVVMNSPAAFCPWPGSIGYAAARAALRGFT